MSEKRRGLGRGLGALIPTAPAVTRGDRPVDVFFPGREDETPRQPRSVFGLEPSAGSGLAAPAGSDVDGDVDGHLARDVGGATGDLDGTTPESSAPDPTHAGAEDDRTDASPATDVAQPTASEGVGAPADAVSRETADGAAATGTDDPEDPDDDGLVEVPGARFAELPVEQITPNPRQPRTVFDEDDMAELAASVATIGVLQPIVVRPVQPAADGSSRYELVMGERRWRASTQAGLATVPAIIRETGDEALLRDALLENLQRSQLNPLEEAAAYAQLLEDFGCTHDVLASRIGRSRPQISNTLRLLRLPPLVQRRVAAGVLSAGHARALLGLDDAAAMERLAQRIVAEGLSVRGVEEIVALGGEDVAPRRPRAPRAGGRSPQLDELAQRLSDRFDTRVQIALGRRKGRLSVEFASVEDLNRILELLAPGDAAVARGVATAEDVAEDAAEGAHGVG